MTDKSVRVVTTIGSFDFDWWNALYTPNKTSDAEFYRKANEKFRNTIDIKKEGVNKE